MAEPVHAGVVSGIATARPHRALAEHIHRLNGAYRASGPERRRETPVPGTALILALEYDWGIAPSQDVPLQRVRSFAGGLTLAPAVSEHGGRIVAFEDLVGARGDRADRAARRARRPAGALRGPPGLDRSPGRGRGTPAARCGLGGAPLDATGGRAPVAEIQRELSCSRPHLASRFREQVGCGPKADGRLVRFNRAAGELHGGTGSLARVAADCGYSDQAHMAREVRAFAGMTPRELRASVTSVQAQPLAAA